MKPALILISKSSVVDLAKQLVGGDISFKSPLKRMKPSIQKHLFLEK